ncbi:MAG TPA: hypothetical protein VLK65_24730 [Vicinamibacteria bacterium]|nr:hypothetical protein [Vicinamibacteria bacterium]
MRHVYLLANLRQHALAEKLAVSVRRYVDGREDIVGHPRIFARAGRVNIEGIPPGIAKELQEWCADELERFRSTSILR